MTLEQFILKRAEKKLVPYRLKAELFKKEQVEYQRYLPQIQERLAKAVFWHGTGRYHYSYQGESRYGGVNADGLLDVLDSIIWRGGLTPHHDPWIDSGGNTVSLGTVRMHSRLFAYIHKYEKDSLLYELGDARYWVRVYLVLSILWICTARENSRQFAKVLFRRTLFKDLQTWASAIRKPKNGTVITLWQLVRGHVLGSDIESNYPLLIGVDKDRSDMIDTVPLTHAIEVRSLQPIALRDFTHIEVPFKNVKETEEFLKTKGVSLRVLPMEFVDAYMSDLPLKLVTHL